MEKVLKVKLNETLASKLEKYVDKTGLTKSELIRYLIAFHIDEAPSKTQILKLQRELSAIGNNLNQIARALNQKNITSEELAETFKLAVAKVYELMSLLDSYKK